MINENRLGGEFLENELMYGLSKIADQKNLEYIHSDIYISLESKGLVYRLDDKELLTEKGKETLENLKKSLNDIWVKHDYNVANYEELLMVTNDVQKTVKDIMSSIEPEVTFDTLIRELLFHNDKGINNSIIISLIQSHIKTVRDLINMDLRLYGYLNSKEAMKSIKIEIKRLENIL